MYLQRGYLHVYNGHGKIRPGGGANYPLHRLLYEEAHGVVLPSSMVVHHINGDPLDNRIENLEAVARSEHPSRHTPSRRDGARRCARCGEWKPESEFSRIYCTMCKRQADREYRARRRAREAA